MSGGKHYTREEKDLVLATVSAALARGENINAGCKEVAILLDRDAGAVQNLYYRLTNDYISPMQQARIEARGGDSKGRGGSKRKYDDVLQGLQFMYEEIKKLRADNAEMLEEVAALKKANRELEQEREDFARILGRARELIIREESPPSNVYKINRDGTIEAKKA